MRGAVAEGCQHGKDVRTSSARSKILIDPLRNDFFRNQLHPSQPPSPDRNIGAYPTAAADMIGVNHKTLRRWLVEDLDSPAHSDMPLRKWRALMSAVRENP